MATAARSTLTGVSLCLQITMATPACIPTSSSASFALLPPCRSCQGSPVIPRLCVRFHGDARRQAYLPGERVTVVCVLCCDVIGRFWEQEGVVWRVWLGGLRQTASRINTECMNMFSLLRLQHCLPFTEVCGYKYILLVIAQILYLEIRYDCIDPQDTER